MLKSTETRSSAILQITYMSSSSAYVNALKQSEIQMTNIIIYAGII